MGGVKVPKSQLWFTLFCLLSVQGKICCSIYKVGDLDAWGIPTSSNPQVYSIWSKYHDLKIGDSLFFLYPPSQDSVIQVTRVSYDSCNLNDPILFMNNGNSLFNITKPGDFYFTSGVEGHCGKKLKLHFSVYGNGSATDSPAYGPTAPAPSYPTVFGSIPVQASSSSPLLGSSLLMVAAAAIFVSILVI